MFPYPKKVRIKKKAESYYLDGGTAYHEVINNEEVGFDYLYQDFRLQSTSQGKWYSSYPKDGADEVLPAFIIFED